MELSKNIGFYTQHYNANAVFQLVSFAINPVTPIMLIILAILKQLANRDVSALTPSRPRNKKLSTFKLCFICT